MPFSTTTAIFSRDLLDIDINGVKISGVITDNIYMELMRFISEEHGDVSSDIYFINKEGEKVETLDFFMNKNFKNDESMRTASGKGNSTYCVITSISYSSDFLSPEALQVAVENFIDIALKSPSSVAYDDKDNLYENKKMVLLLPMSLGTYNTSRDIDIQKIDTIINEGNWRDKIAADLGFNPLKPIPLENVIICDTVIGREIKRNLSMLYLCVIPEGRMYKLEKSPFVRHNP